ncbi:MAG: glycoside hydrolase family 97 N-terminal domain-containing protein [Puniceicoccales bacterium]|jgi:alpha-glucosidase|nr:glycoside hydrolase family 97 N-terminal domain-containing protein [Puniceicoccales bacterium]
MFPRFIRIFFSAFFLFAGTQTHGGASGAPEVRLPGPDASFCVILSVKNNAAGYALTHQGIPLLEWAPLGVVINGNDTGANAAPFAVRGDSGPQEVRFPVSGKHAEGKVAFIEYRVDAGARLSLRFRVFNDGVAFRYEFFHAPDAGARVDGESTGFGIPPGARLQALEGGPLTARLASGYFLLIQEAGCFGLGWAQLQFDFNAGVAARAAYAGGAFAFPVGAAHSPWRVILGTRNLGALVNSDIADSLVPPPDPVFFPSGAATAWVRPGRATLSREAGGTSGFEGQIALVNLAGELGYEHHFIGMGWEQWRRGGEDNWALLSGIVKAATKKNVGVWVEKRASEINNYSGGWAQLHAFLTRVKAVGAAGVRLSLDDGGTQEALLFCDAARHSAAALRLMLIFHGTGISGGEGRAWPHVLTGGSPPGSTRRTAAVHDCTLPFSLFVAGPSGFSSILLPEGVRSTGFSWAHQLARAIVFTSPLRYLETTPEAIRAAAPAGSPQREILKSIPAVWDETIVLPGAEPGAFAIFARRKGKTWYAGILNGAQSRKGTLKLGFLTPGINYAAILLYDDMKEPHAWNSVESILTAADSVPLEMRGAGGALIRLTPLDSPDLPRDTGRKGQLRLEFP